VFLALFVQASPLFDFNVESGNGLKVQVQGIPIIQGSFFQVYAPGWKKGYYSSRWYQQQIKKVDDNTISMSFYGPERVLTGDATYHRVRNELRVTHNFNWNSDEPALIEYNTGQVWLPPFQDGSATIGASERNLPQLPPVGDLQKRLLGPAANRIELKGSAVIVGLESQTPAITFDARGYNQDWAEQKPLYWQGIQGVELKKGKTASISFTYKFSTKSRDTQPPKSLNLPSIELKDGLTTIQENPVLVPKPKKAELNWDQDLVISNAWHFPAGKMKFFDLLKSELQKRFELPAVGSVPGRISIDGGMSDLQKLPGAYRLEIKPQSVSFIGEKEEGLRNAIYRFVQICRIKNGRIVAPIGVIEDEPRTDFRGVHLFVGPKAPEFHQKLWENVLRPLGFNKVVLQCERTEWKTLPAVRDEMTMSQTDLVKLFRMYREMEVEPIPLIQSFGHMEWFFARGVNLDLAYNRNAPYAIDPRKPEARELVGKLWDEVVNLLKPSTIHFGLDEVDMRGFERKDPKLVTSLWEQMLPYLGEVAKRNKTKMMLWGDKGLAPGEAIDAALGDDKTEAAKRRAAIPAGSIITDWHYAADQNHSPFLKSLQTWKLDGFQPIASTWYRPENIRGFYTAASVENAGTLQTTWAGYESNEANMIKAVDQFAAMILAGDYSWSGRYERIEELPYNYREVFAKMYTPVQSPLKPQPLRTLGRGELFWVGNVGFSKLIDTDLVGVQRSNYNAPKEINFALSGTGSEIVFALGTDIASANAEKLGTLTLTYSDGKTQSVDLLYGVHVRAESDQGYTLMGRRENGITALRLPLQDKNLSKASIVATNLSGGLKVLGVSIIPKRGTKGK
jgi:hypothetical protein